MNITNFFVGFIALIAAGCAGSLATLTDPAHPAVIAARQRMDYELAEHRKWRDQHESICFEGARVRSLDLFYNIYSREGSQLLLPPLNPDFVRHAVEEWHLYDDDPELQATLTGPVNDALNSRLKEINAGVYNTVYVRISFAHFIAISPFLGSLDAGSVELQEREGRDLVMVWASEGIARSVMRQVASRAEMDRLASFDGEGNLVAARDDAIAFDPLAVFFDARSRSQFSEFVSFPPQQFPARCTSRISGRVPSRR